MSPQTTQELGSVMVGKTHVQNDPLRLLLDGGRKTLRTVHGAQNFDSARFQAELPDLGDFRIVVDTEDLRSGEFANYEQCFDESLQLAAEISQPFRVAISEKRRVLAAIREAFVTTSPATAP